VAHLLVIEDDELIRKYLRQALEDAGHEVDTATNGREGAAAFRRKPADLIITDIFMPESDGLEVILQMKRDNPSVRIIAMSGGGARVGNFDFLSVAESFGAAATLKKPFSTHELFDAINKALAG